MGEGPCLVISGCSSRGPRTELGGLGSRRGFSRSGGWKSPSGGQVGETPFLSFAHSCLLAVSPHLRGRTRSLVSAHKGAPSWRIHPRDLI